jgi:hypothetical protein
MACTLTPHFCTGTFNQICRMIGTHEIERMSRTEKLAPPRWHKKVLKKRLAKVMAGNGKFLTIAQLKNRLAR